MAATVTALESRVMALQDAFYKLKKLNNDTFVKVGLAKFVSANSFAAWWTTNCTRQDVHGFTPPNGFHLCFPNVMGLLAMAFRTHDDVTNDLEDLTQSQVDRLCYFGGSCFVPVS